MVSIVYLHLILGAVPGTCLVLFWSSCPYCRVLSSSNQLCLHCTWLLVLPMCLWASQYFQSWVFTLVLLSICLYIPFLSSPSSPSVLFLHLLLSPKYLYPVSSMSLMLFPSGSCIPSVLVILPLWMLTCAHFSIPNSILMSPETILTVSLVPLPNSLMSSGG